MGRWVAFHAGVTLSVLALVLLFVRPQDSSLAFSLLILAGALLTFQLNPDGPESTRDVSSRALAIAAAAVAVLFVLWLLPASLWHALGRLWHPIEEFALQFYRVEKPDEPPLWARLAVAAAWVVLIRHRYLQHKRRAEQHAAA